MFFNKHVIPAPNVIPAEACPREAGAGIHVICYQVLNQTRQTVLAAKVRPAVNWWQRFKGLLGQKQLAPGQGLWLKPCHSIHSIGMSFSFDAIFLDSDLKVLAAYSDIAPGRVILPVKGAQSVLELPAGAVINSQTVPGDRLSITVS